MKVTEMQMAIIALIVIGLLYLYNNPTVVYKNKPVYYPVYETEYVPVNRGFRPYPGGRLPGHHGGHHIRKVDPIMPPAIPVMPPAIPFK
jgi:hypothetical protein